MVAKMEIVPFQWLPIGIKTLHHALLNRKRAVPVMAAVKNHRRAFDLPRGVARMTRPDTGGRFVGNRGIIGDKGTRPRGGGNEMDTEPPAHAVTDDSNPRSIHIVARANITPASVDDSEKIRVRCLVLNLRALINMRFRRIAKHVIEIGNHCGVTELGKAVGRSLQISG